MLDTLQQQKSLPHSDESERAVLAGAILDPALLPTMSGRLVPDDFYSDRHRILFSTMLDLQEAEVEIDIRTLQASLEQQDRLTAIGGVAYLASLDLDLPDLSRMDSYVEIVKERSIRRRLIEACGEITRNCLDGGFQAQEEAVQKGFIRLSQIFHETLADLEERPARGFIGVPTGYTDLDDMTRGLNPGNLVIIAGRPGMGKTSLALNIAEHAAIRERKPVGVFSLEMSQEELALRILSSEVDVPFGPLRSGLLSQKQWS